MHCRGFSNIPGLSLPGVSRVPGHGTQSISRHYQKTPVVLSFPRHCQISWALAETLECREWAWSQGAQLLWGSSPFCYSVSGPSPATGVSMWTFCFCRLVCKADLGSESSREEAEVRKTVNIYECNP